MKRSSVILRLTGLTLTPIAGIIGLLLADDRWDVLFLVLASLPLFAGSGVVILRFLERDREYASNDFARNDSES